jgi:hypothetical protein
MNAKTKLSLLQCATILGATAGALVQLSDVTTARKALGAFVQNDEWWDKVGAMASDVQTMVDSGGDVADAVGMAARLTSKPKEGKPQ